MEKSRKRIANNAIWMICAKVVQAILGLILTILNARYLGPSNYGILSYGMSVVSFVSPLALLGINNIQVQEYVNYPEEEGVILGSSIFMVIISSTLCICGVMAFTFIADHGRTETNLVLILYSLMLIFQGTELIMYWFQAKFLTKYYALISLFAYISVSGYKLFLLLNKYSVWLFALSNSIDYFIISILLFIIYKRKGGKKVWIDLVVCKRLLSKSKYYILPNLMISIFSQTDNIMIKHMLGESNSGYYQVALTCTSYLGFVYAAIIDAFRPHIFEEKKVSSNSYEKAMVELFSYVLYLGIFSGILITVLSKWIIITLYGMEYVHAVPALKVLAWQPLFAYLGVSRNVWVLAESKQQSLLKINAIAALLNVFLNLLLIPRIGIVGAAIASVFSQILVNILFNYLYRPFRMCGDLLIMSIKPIPLKDIMNYFIHKILKH